MNRRTAFLAGATGLVAAVAVTPAAQAAQAAEPVNPELEKVQALLKAHDDATTNHDLAGVMKCLTEKPALMGTGPGEMWSGTGEVRDAYQHFFEGYDKGHQDFAYHFKVGNLGPDMGWLMAAGNVTGKKAGKDFTYPLNVSLTVTKAGGEWKISAMHFSTLTGGPGPVTS